MFCRMDDKVYKVRQVSDGKIPLGRIVRKCRSKGGGYDLYGKINNLLSWAQYKFCKMNDNFHKNFLLGIYPSTVNDIQFL